MNQNFNIQEYLANGAETLVKDAIRASLKNPKESLFLAKFAKHTKKASKIRKQYSEKGQNIPIFLISLGSVVMHSLFIPDTPNLSIFVFT